MAALPRVDSRAIEIEMLPVPALVLDQQGRASRINGPAGRLFGSTDYLEADPALALGDLAEIKNWLVSSGAGAVQGWRMTGQRASGVPITLDLTATRLGPGAALCILQELSAERLEGEAKRHLDAAFEFAPIGMALFNTNGEYIRVNAALCEMLDREPEQLLGHRDQEFTHPEDREADIEPAWRILRGEIDSWQCEKRFTRPDGGVAWAIANMSFLRTAEGHPLAWVGQFQDITARREQEEALREAEERLRLAFDGAAIGMALVAPDGAWLKVNRSLCEMTGYTEEQLLGSTFQAITHPEDLDADLELVERVLAGDLRSYEMEKRYFRADGSVMWVLLSVSLVRSAQGEPRYFVSQIQDISARKAAEHAMAELRAELERSNADLSQFASAVSHDLGQPLAIIAGYGALLEHAEGLSESERFQVSAIVRGADRMNAMIDGLLSLARVGGTGIPDESCELADALDDAIEVLQPQIEQTGAVLDVGALPMIAGDRTQLSQVFQNLIGNALKFRSGPSPRITVGATPHGSGWRIRVTDDGIGIPPESAAAVFQPFARLTGSSHRGDGLGLAITKRIVERHGGEVGVEARTGPGTTIFIQLPAISERDRSEAAVPGVRELVSRETA